MYILFNVETNIFRKEKHPLSSAQVHSCEKAFNHSGLRLTPQRRHIYNALMTRRNHPSAMEVFLRVKKTAPTISLATVYNCLETLVARGLVRQVHVDREPTRYCANLEEHGHFVCNQCGSVRDVEWTVSQQPILPDGYKIHSREMTLRGLCSKCSPTARPFSPSTDSRSTTES